MTKQPAYGNTAKVFHWLIVVLLVVQFAIGWLMPDIQPGAPPGSAMTYHISIGLIILMLIILRLAWRLFHPVAPADTLPRWQRLTSESVHWLLYGLVFATAMSGWFFASFRGWQVSPLFGVPLPMLAAPESAAVRLVGGWHQAAGVGLLIAIGVHVTAAFMHAFVFRDRTMQRMLPRS
ncbi:MAG: cytochrome b [Rhizobiales bacterium]|nr:cytochrome b [Hyphomicrobiales bacterium]